MGTPITEQWFEAARVDELPPGGMKRLEVDGHRYLLINTDGGFYAIEDRCSHEDIPLHLGCIQGDKIKCALHGSRFNLKTGEPLEEPATEPITTYPVHITDGRIYVRGH